MPKIFQYTQVINCEHDFFKTPEWVRDHLLIEEKLYKDKPPRVYIEHIKSGKLNASLMKLGDYVVLDEESNIRFCKKEIFENNLKNIY